MIALRLHLGFGLANTEPQSIGGNTDYYSQGVESTILCQRYRTMFLSLAHQYVGIIYTCSTALSHQILSLMLPSPYFELSSECCVSERLAPILGERLGVIGSLGAPPRSCAPKRSPLLPSASYDWELPVPPLTQHLGAPRVFIKYFPTKVFSHQRLIHTIPLSKSPGWPRLNGFLLFAFPDSVWASACIYPRTRFFGLSPQPADCTV
jgi:hypothetical protein